MVDTIGSEMLTDAKPLNVDEAKKKLKLGGKKAKDFEQKVLEKQDGQFSKLMSVIYGWKVQDDGSKKLVSRMPSGKILFPDRSEDIDSIEPGIAYICLVYDRQIDEKGEPGREAFAKIICEESHPIIFVPDSKIPVMVWTEPNGKKRNKVPIGNTYEDRMMQLIKEAEAKGFPFVRVVFRRNQKVLK